MRSGLAVEPDHQRRGQALELRRHRHVGNQRDVRGLHAAIGEIDRGRRLRGARNARQYDVGVLQIVGVLTVVMQHGVVQRVDALEVFGVERVLRADALGRFGAEIGLEQRQHRIENRQARQAELAALGFAAASASVVLEHGVEHDAGRGLDLGDDAIELLVGAHQRIDVLDRRDGGILRRGRARDRDQRLAGRVRDEMQMKEIAALRHRSACGCTAGEGHGFPASASTRGQADGTTPAFVPIAQPVGPRRGLPLDMVNKWITGGRFEQNFDDTDVFSMRLDG